MISSDLLKEVYFFKEFSDDDLSLVKEICERKKIGAYHAIFHEGDVATHMYLVEWGSVRIIKNEEEIITVGRGGTFGEVPFLDGDRRSGTAFTLEESHLIEIPYQRLTKLLLEHPKVALKFYTTASRFVSKRLRSVMESLGHMKELVHNHHFPM